MRQRVADAGAHDKQLGKARLVCRAAAKVGIDRGADLSLMPLGQRQQALQPVFPNAEVRKGLLLEGGALQRNRSTRTSCLTCSIVRSPLTAVQLTSSRPESS